MLQVIIGTKATLNMLCSSPKPIIAYSHKAKPFNFHKLCFAFMDNQTRTNGLFTTANINKFAFGIAQFINAFISGCIINFCFSKWIPITKTHNYSPLAPEYSKQSQLVSITLLKLAGYEIQKSKFVCYYISNTWVDFHTTNAISLWEGGVV